VASGVEPSGHTVFGGPVIVVPGGQFVSVAGSHCCCGVVGSPVFRSLLPSGRTCVFVSLFSPSPLVSPFPVSLLPPLLLPPVSPPPLDLSPEDESD
jgi:hypothetical protein